MNDDELKEESILLQTEKQQKRTKNLSFSAALILIFAGAIAIISWFPFLISQDQIVSLFQQNFERINIMISAERIKSLITTIGAIEIILSLLVIISGILALMRKRWGFALIFSLLGFFTVGPFFISSVLAIIGLVVLYLAKNEFN